MLPRASWNPGGVGHRRTGEPRVLGQLCKAMYLTSAFHEASTLALGFATGSSCVLGDPARLGPGSCRAHGLDIKLDSWDIVTIKA